MSLADVRLVHNRGRSRQYTCLVPHARLHHGTRILSTLQLRGRQFLRRHCCHGSNSGISTLLVTLLVRGGGCSAAVSQFSDRRLFQTGGKMKTRWYVFRLRLAVPRGLAFVWALCSPVAIHSPPLKQLLRLGYRLSRGICHWLSPGNPCRPPTTWSAL